MWTQDDLIKLAIIHKTAILSYGLRLCEHSSAKEDKQRGYL